MTRMHLTLYEEKDMARLNLTVDGKLLERFRKAANEKFGYKKGALKKAAEEAIEKWLKLERKT